MSAKNIFVIGRDDLNFAKLESLARAGDYRFHAVLDFEQVQGEHALPVHEILRRAEAEIAAFKGRVDAIISLWDFPVSCLLPILCERFGVPTPPLESVIKCHHKYWSRLEQQRVAPGSTPRFATVDPFDDRTLDKIELDFPFWLKPIKAFRSQLAFKIVDAGAFEQAIQVIREKIPRFAEPFDFFLQRLSMPAEVAGVHGGFCIAEEVLAGRQGALEGYVYQGEAEVYGVIESVKEPGRSPFSRFQYPSTLPTSVQERAGEIAKQVVLAIGLDPSPFNVEFFYHEEQDRISLLEINPRISLSNSDMFEKVDGLPNQKIMVEAALGRRPQFPHREGPFGYAGKFFLRKYEDACVTAVPSRAEIKRIEGQVPGSMIKVGVSERVRLSELQDQDSYSFELADIYVGGASVDEMEKNYRKCAKALKFSFSE
jgi:biotin carboxylase